MPPPERPRILVIEDQRKVAQALAEGLRGDGFDVSIAATGSDGYFLATTEPFVLLVLDWMLPGRDGIEVLKSLRKKGITTPVLILTARDDVDDRVVGLDAGADDYLVKPFAYPEVAARIRALLRRSRHESEAAVLRCADLVLEPKERRGTRGTRPLELTTREFKLLEFLLRHRGHLVSREMLAREVWQEPARATSLDNVIDVTMTRLRRKIDGDTATKLLHTVRGVGFVLREGPE